MNIVLKCIFTHFFYFCLDLYVYTYIFVCIFIQIHPLHRHYCDIDLVLVPRFNNFKKIYSFNVIANYFRIPMVSSVCNSVLQ